MKKNEGFMSKFASSLEMPKDVVLGGMNLRIIGQYEAYIENYKSIIEYTAELIRLQGRHNKIMLTGHNLKIVDYSKDDMHIRGIIQKIVFI